MLADVDTWPDALQAAIADSSVLQRVFVVRETDSTQDAARRMSARPGDVLVAGRQTKGRGRLGRPWADTASHGIAMTFVLDRDTPERLVLASAVAAARAAESLLHSPSATLGDSAGHELESVQPRVGIKWPNDVFVDGRKLAGVLVEQAASRAYIGVGMNVTQRSWPPELQDIAISIAQCGGRATRLDAAAALLRAFNDALSRSDDDLIENFSKRDVLRGQPATIQSGGAIITGIVRDINPLTGLLIETDTGEVRLPAQTTSVVKA